MKNVLVWGNGFVGSHLKYDKIRERATTNADDVRAILKVYKPDVLINCVGYCGAPNIDACETNKEKTIITNTVIPSIMATECDKLGIHFVHIGSGCIFSGSSPNIYCKKCKTKHTWYIGAGPCDEVDLGWRETDPANPVSFYSNTKYACDLAIGSLPNTAILRIRMPISSKNTQRNFINKILGYKQIIDIPNSVSFVDDIVRCVDWMIDGRKTGIYNVVNDEPLTAADVVREYQKYHPEHTFSVITGDELDKMTKAKRSNCILDGGKLKKEGFIMTDTELALRNCMKEYVRQV